LAIKRPPRPVKMTRASKRNADFASICPFSVLIILPGECKLLTRLMYEGSKLKSPLVPLYKRGRLSCFPFTKGEKLQRFRFEEGGVINFNFYLSPFALSLYFLTTSSRFSFLAFSNVSFLTTFTFSTTIRSACF